MVSAVLTAIAIALFSLYFFSLYREANQWIRDWAMMTTMRKLDYGINAFGIISAIAYLGFLGTIALALAMTFFWFLNFYIWVVSIGVLIFKGFAKMISLFPNRQRAASLATGSWRYLFYALTNSLSTLAMFSMLHFDLKPWRW